MTTLPERSNKLTPRWKGPFRVRRIPNEYQVVYEDGAMWRTVHIIHTKPAKFTAPDLPEPVPAPETPRPSFGYLPSGLLGPRPPPPASAAPAEGSSSSPTASIPAQPPAAPAASEMQPPATAPANQQPESAFRPRQSPRLNPEPGRVCTIKGPPGNPSPQSEKSATMARTYPLTVPYNQCLGARTDRLSFSSLYLEDLKKWTEPIPELHEATSRRPAENGEPHLAFCIAGTHRLPWSKASAAFHESGDVVVAALRRRILPVFPLPPVLSHTPGTACGLVRG